MRKIIILLAALITGTSQSNYSRETISGPYDFEAMLVLLEIGNGSLGINNCYPEWISTSTLVTDQMAPDNRAYNRPPFLGKSFNGFKEALAFQESRGDYFAMNDFGYLGKYQFGEGTLAVLGVYDSEGFLNDPRLQEEVFYANVSRNKWLLRREINNYSGQGIMSVTITESGILAAAHLAGPGNVKKYLRSGGQLDCEDAYGTQISDYLKKFAGYDTSEVNPVQYPRRQSKGKSLRPSENLLPAKGEILHMDKRRTHP